MSEWNEHEREKNTYECNERKQKKLEQKAIKFASNRASKMTRILSPHRYESNNDIFGRNDLEKLAIDPAYNKSAWPPYKPSPLVLNDSDPIKTFYEPLLEKMCDTYFEHAFKKHGYKSYDEIKQLPQFDISSLTKDAYSLVDVKFKTDESCRNIAEQYGSEIFLPCIPEYVIKLNKCHLLYVKLIENQDGISTIQFDDYITECRKVSCISRGIILSEYIPETQEIKWTAQEYTTYEDFLVRDMDDMNWSDKEKQFWFDVFGVYPFDSPTIIRVPIVFNTNDMTLVDTSMTHREPFVVYRKEDADSLIKECKKIMPAEVDIIENGDSVILKQKQSRIEDTYPQCLTAIALVNLQFVKSGINAVNPDESSSNVKIGDMTVRTKAPIRTSLKT